MEEWRANTVVVTCNTEAGETKKLTRYPDSIVPMTPAGYHYSRGKRYRCAADKIDGHCACNSYGTKAFGYKCYQEFGREQDIWLCAICENHMGLRPATLDPLTPVNNLRADPLCLRIRDTNSNVVEIHLCGGSIEFAVQLIMDGNINVTRRTPPTDEEVLEHCTEIWYIKYPGTRRGSEFVGFNGNFRRVRDALMSMAASKEVIDFYEDTDGGQIYFIIPALYLKSHLANNEQNSFKYHVDEKYKGKPARRSNWTWNEGGKVMRFQNRKNGLYIDIACFHGTIVEQDWFASGCDDSHVMEHAVFCANGTATITFDHGRFVESDEVNLLAAYEEFEREYNSDDEDEEDEGGD